MTELEDLKRELELVKASKRADRAREKQHSDVVVSLDELRRRHEMILKERDYLVMSMAKWRDRALVCGWQETFDGATE